MAQKEKKSVRWDFRETSQKKGSFEVFWEEHTHLEDFRFRAIVDSSRRFFDIYSSRKLADIYSSRQFFGYSLLISNLNDL